jgi:hypothetical protein
MLGYDEISRDCYKILTIPDGKIISRKDVIFDVEHLVYSLPDLIEAAEGRDGFLEFENKDLEVTDDDKLVGDEIAPYFALTREEYGQEIDKMEESRRADEETCEQIELQMQNAYFAQENAINDILVMVHAPHRSTQES